MRGIFLGAQILGSLLILGLQVCQSNASSGSKLLCDCALNDVRSSKLIVSCSKTKDDDKGVSCSKDVVPRISRGYRYIPGYGLFKLFKTAMVWTRAQKTCEQDGGNLYIPKDPSLNAILANIFGRIQMFTGLSDVASEGIFLGVDKKVYLDLKWAPNEPNGERKENCVTMVFEGTLNDIDCGGAFPFICQRNLAALPPEGYVYADGFGFYKVYGDKKVFAEAQKTCEADGGDLAVPDTFEKVEALIEVVRSDSQRLDEFWMGLNDTKQEGRFVTQSGRPLSSMEYENWRTNEPNNVYPGENCLMFYPDGRMNDEPCESKRNFVCELSIPLR